MPDPAEWDPSRLRRVLSQKLEGLLSAGVAQIPRRDLTPAVNMTATSAPAAAEPASDSPSNIQAEASDGLTIEDRRESLSALADRVSSCTRCEELVCSRTRTVFGVGNIQPRLCFFGEAPGAEEDRQGEPFVGAAGQLLNKIIGAMSLRREDVYILNVLKCRPPGNRNPAVEEVANCRPYFERQLEILNPEFICCLGSYAAKTLLETDASVGRMRGRFHEFGEARVVVTYHPAYLLRNPDAKRKTWEDIQMLMAEMGLESRAKK